MPVFGRVLTAMATPMHPDGSLDLDGAQRLAAHLVEHGNDGVFVAGTTGESPTLDHDETLSLLRAVVEAVGGRAMVVAGCGKNDTAATVRLVGEATDAGVDGVVLVTPYYNKPAQRGLEAHFAAAAAATPLPVMLYNIPSRTACEIAPQTLLRIAEATPNVRAVKDAVGDFPASAWVASRAPESFEVYAGDDVSLLPLLAVGGVGVVSVAGHLVGEQLARMVDVFPKDPGEARAVHWRLLPLFRALFAETNPVPLKAALRLVGLPAGPVRPPLAEAADATVTTVRRALAALDLPGDGAA
ncbi:MAG: 4-hydroxy-tetrahydrodipicolinate synthase [Actinobacteria bacterium]|nr:4-hydroxy-tetrahydrodipicolinate synthase [Actinomycetota bacterium]